VVSLNPPGRAKPGSVGLPIPGVEVKVVAEDESELAPGEIGELIIKGPNVMKGYLNLPLETQETIKGGWLFSGDLARMDEEGYIYIIDRKKDMLISHGMNVYPREIEMVLLQHSKIKEAVVIGKKDSRKGEIPVAFVVTKEGERLTSQEVINFCNQRLANYKVPHIIEFRKDLPKTPTGKVLKRKLK
jgi:long-chain acyl-CoA synthetase